MRVMLERVLTVAAFVAIACTSKVDPDKSRFSCTTDADCGSGYECRAQFEGSSLCFKDGVCQDVELCNGEDDNCDGRIDEIFSDEGEACTTGEMGPCAAGTKSCVVDGGVSTVVCVRAVNPIAEICNTIDDDCDGTADEDFDLLTDSSNCGACGRACAAGASCAMSNCYETACDDGVDNDLDGGADCADPACQGRACSLGATFNCGRVIDDGGFADGGLDGGEMDGGVIDAGVLTVPMCVPRESVCDDGEDDDLDARIDCDDADCDGKTCATGMTCSTGACR